MAGFKKGAFSVACKAGVDVVPVTLLGTGGVYLFYHSYLIYHFIGCVL